MQPTIRAWAQVAQTITAAGLVPFAWMWLLLDDPQAEAQVVVCAFRDGFQGFVFDTESDKCHNRFEQAIQLGQYLSVAGIDSGRLYNCSFPNISHHRSWDPITTSTAACACPRSSSRSGSLTWRRTAPLFISVFSAAVLNDDLLPLIQAFPLGEGPALLPAGVKVDVVSPYVGYLNIRPTPSTEKLPMARADHGAMLEALEPQASVEAKVVREGQWLRVRTSAGEGYVAAWYLRLHREKAPVKVAVKVQVVSPELGFLNLRPSPSTMQPPVMQLDDGVVLEALESEEDVKDKVGQAGRWLHVRTTQGVEGYVAAQYLRLYVGVPIGKASHVIVHSDVGLNVRQGPGTDSPILWHIENRTVETCEEKAGEKVGKDRWLKVRTPSLHEGYVNGLYVRTQPQADMRKPVERTALSAGGCAWLFGIHAAGATTPADFPVQGERQDRLGALHRSRRGRSWRQERSRLYPLVG